MPRTKRTTTKTGNNSRRTTTFSSTGNVTQSFSNRPTKASSRRTVSYNHKTGKMRTTYSTKQGGGWTNITTKTETLVSKSRNKKSNIDLSGLITFPLLFFGGIAIWIMVEWPSTAPYIISFALVIGLIIFIFSIIHYIIWGGIIIGILWLLSLL